MAALRPEKTPTTVLTGFLGSGKTTLLNRALKHAAFANSAVVVNELGEIALDHLLVSEGREGVVLTETGCLCCAALDSLPSTLEDLFGRRARGDLPPFERVFIETTGLADPAPILRTLLRDPVVSYFTVLDGLVCTVDARLGAGQIADEAEAAAQAAMADRIVVTKTDVADPETVQALEAALRRRNPAAEVLRGEAPLEALLGPIVSHGSAFSRDQAVEADGAPPAHDHDLAGGRHDASVAALSFWLEGSVNWAGLAAWTEWARGRFGPQLLRCKGLFEVEGEARPVALQGVQTIFDTMRLPAWPDADRRSRLVVIGRGLARDELAASLSLFHGD